MRRLRASRILIPPLLVMVACACARYSPDPDTAISSKVLRKSGPVEAVVKVLSSEQIRSALDYDIAEVRLVAVSAMIRNRGKEKLQLDYLRTRLVDGNLTYGLVPVEAAILRTQRTGFWKAQAWMRTLGLIGYMIHQRQISGVNDALREDFAWKALPEKPIIPNATLRGILFFQIDPASARRYDPDIYGVVISLASPGDPPVIEIRFPGSGMTY